jgi:hypothetical protein
MLGVKQIGTSSMGHALEIHRLGIDFRAECWYVFCDGELIDTQYPSMEFARKFANLRFGDIKWETYPA